MDNQSIWRAVLATMYSGADQALLESGFFEFTIQENARGALRGMIHPYFGDEIPFMIRDSGTPHASFQSGRTEQKFESFDVVVVVDENGNCWVKVKFNRSREELNFRIVCGFGEIPIRPVPIQGFVGRFGSPAQ